MTRIRIGTSGWHYGHWRGLFYPAGLRPAEQLAYYAGRFDAVEVNNTFYRLPRRETLASWRRQVPDGFVFACKASRFITHYGKLTTRSRSYALLFDLMSELGDRLGPILFQTPPGWRVDPERLEDFLAALPAGFRYAFEFRDESWFCQRVYDLLAARGAAFCIYHLAFRLSPLTVTSDLVYVRLHGPSGPYAGSYSDEDLATWADRLRGWQDEGAEVHCYFDNDAKAFAIRDALRLRGIMGTSPSGGC